MTNLKLRISQLPQSSAGAKSDLAARLAAKLLEITQYSQNRFLREVLRSIHRLRPTAKGASKTLT